MKFISLNIKTAVIYTLLALLTITIVTTLIFENQSDLIVKNTLTESQIIITGIINDINKTSILNDADDSQTTSRLVRLLKKHSSGKFSIYNEGGNLLTSSQKERPEISASRHDFTRINRAIFNKENNNKQFYADISRSITPRKEVHFYIPFRNKNGTYIVVKLEHHSTSIEKRMDYLYRQVGILIAGMLLVVLFIGLIFRRIIIRPIEEISQASEMVAQGDFTAITACTSNDELGVLSTQFNAMVRSLDEKTIMLNNTINTLEAQNHQIQLELDLAQTIQGGMLPETDSFRNIRIISYFQPLEKISGDFFDIVEFPDGSIGIIIVDVSGHGIPAALITIMIKFLVSSYGPDYRSPEELLKKMNGELAKVIKSGDYVTAFYVIIGADNTLRHSNAGHTCSLLHRKVTHDISELYGEGLFLGLVDNDTVTYDVYELQIDNGDRLIFYTDGITEQQNTDGEMYGIDRFYAVIMENIQNESQELMDIIINDLKEFSKGAPQNDDTTLLIVDINNRKH